MLLDIRIEIEHNSHFSRNKFFHWLDIKSFMYSFGIKIDSTPRAPQTYYPVDSMYLMLRQIEMWH